MSELRAHTNKTVISIDDIMVRPRTDYTGAVCGEVTNTGQRTANNLNIHFILEMEEWLANELERPIRGTMSDIYVARLQPGTKQNACAEYQILYEDDNKPFDSQLDYVFVELFERIKYNIRYSEDPVARADYKGEIMMKDVEIREQ